MVSKKFLREDVDYLKKDVANFRKRICDIEKNQKIEIGEGKAPREGFWYTTRGIDGLIYTEITTKEMLIALLKHLNLEIITVEPEPESFKIKTIEKQKKGK